MLIVRTYEELKDLNKSGILSPVILTIGNFDGVHLGHQALLKHVVEVAERERKTPVVVTFSNHPSEVLRPLQQSLHLCSTKHKLKLIEDEQIGLTLLLTFTKEFSQQSAEQFLHGVREVLPYQALILGSDAHIGKDREGDQKTITSLAKKLGFSVDYFPDCNIDGQRISSSRIRECIGQGRLKDAEKLLGRPYSIYGEVSKGSGKGAPMGFPTANLSVDKLCMPPQGVYAVTLWAEGQQHAGVANLGIAPTVHHDRTPLLEVHLFDKTINLYGKFVDVQMHTFLRPERHFESHEALKKQIAEDIHSAKIALNTIVTI